MKRFLVALTALIASLTIGLATVSTTAGATGGDQVAQSAKKIVKKKKFRATIRLTVTVTPASTYSAGSGSFSGTVSSGGPAACKSGRLVRITRNGAVIASMRTRRDGSYSLTVNAAPPDGQYAASTPKVVKKKKNKKTGTVTKKVCLPATTAPLTIYRELT